MTKNVTIVPTISVCMHTYRIAAEAIMSHYASEPDAHLIVLDNAPLGEKHEWDYWTEQLKQLLDRLGYEYRHYDEPWNLPKFWNKGLDIAANENWDYVAISNVDVWFAPRWFTSALNDWAEVPVEQDIVSVHPWSYVSKDAGHNIKNLNYHYEDVFTQGMGLVPFDFPACHVSIFKGKTDYRFDESYHHYYVDNDFWKWMQKTKRYGALSKSSRVDHLQMAGYGRTMTKVVDFSVNHGIAKVDTDFDHKYFHEKWQ